jgi:hypothetical protein
VVKTANYPWDINAPWMNISCCPQESFSSGLSIVSLNNQVEPMPVNVTPANILRLEKQPS